MIAHTREDGETQAIVNHLKGTAALAAQFAAAFDAEQWGELTGLLHDIGKYSKDFQEHIRHPEKKWLTVDHSTAGAKEALNHHLMPAAVAIAGHHSGLPDVGVRSDGTESGSFWGRTKKTIPDYSLWNNDISLPQTDKLNVPCKTPFEMAFFIRMLYSCLVDADFLDTETFMQGESRLVSAEKPGELLEHLRKNVDPWLKAKNLSPLNQLRNKVLTDCIHAGQSKPQGLYTLTVPTGGGKTISSLAFALEQAVRNGQRRIIYVIPYTSIIDQTARKFSEILGEENVLAHYSGAEYQLSEKDQLTPENQKKVLASENWDAPVVVTTAVQFFESLYAARSSKCRKLHNIANSVIIFDEAQTLPLPYLRPCVAVIAELVQHYKVTAVLCTATQPALDNLFRDFLPIKQIKEICPDSKTLFEPFRRTRLHQIGELDCKQMAQRLSQAPQVLCVVNRRKTAQELFEQLPEKGRFCLTTLLCPADRKKKLDEIRRRLKEGECCRVVSTSLIEAGVDVDFPAAYRELAGLDSIIQTAGRCNREGKRSVEESPVYIFSLQECAIPQMLSQNVSALKNVQLRHDALDTPEAIHLYFRGLQIIKGNAALDRKEIVKHLSDGTYPFETVSKDFSLIETPTKQIYLPIGEGISLCEQLRTGFHSRSLFRRMGMYSVQVYPDHFKKLYEAGGIELLDSGDGILTDLSLYDENIGLTMDVEPGQCWFI